MSVYIILPLLCFVQLKVQASRLNLWQHLKLDVSTMLLMKTRQLKIVLLGLPYAPIEGCI